MSKNNMDPDNYRWPAEWEPHTATWVAWPIKAQTWPGIFERIPSAFAEFVAAIALFEPVNVLLPDAGAEPIARQLLDVACERNGASFDIRFVAIPVNDSWCRDYGPIFLNQINQEGNGPCQVILNWDYNAWGGKYPPWDDDARVTNSIAERLNVSSLDTGIILEGGAIEGNGAGTLLTTESCLKNPNRNTVQVRASLEDSLARFLRVDTVVWLPGHGVIGDDTDGHVDQIARFTNATDVLVAAAHDNDAPEAADLRANFEAVAEAQDGHGNSLTPVPLKLPSPKYQQGHRLPASYCNFYIANGGVIVPTFHDDADDTALQMIQAAFPRHEVIGLDAVDIVWGLGAFHCLTQQQPAPPLELN